MRLTLYHASTVVVESPDVVHSREFLDFGRGFYLTSIYDQANKYAQRFLRRGSNAYVNVYSFEAEPDKWNILHFNFYNKEWLDFVAKCRNGENVGDYDMVVGGIADDKVILTLELYFNGQISQKTALERLRFEHPNIQYCIRSQKMLEQCLTFVKSAEL